ncbi:putative lipoprotein [Emticicia oligotrophica DSM 17448]|uniref:Lipoprotein n=1 Tax=Emticicia oligotrophica (strain DSM 17448 / CIP 109782 / MTCC 6937 / GPTSA100-15) TaxID=929562 RepID=A0ABM5N383_EMTOG|nr:DUF4382 domain-containing protein [Emticicia oligotrophica]AFK03856.1 putative lipoprotein [Emticicia oligotrophica DSM 17448]
MKTFKIAILMASMFLLQVACQKQDDSVTPVSQQDPNAPKGDMRIGITDAPIDDTNINGVFVTITEIRFDGKVYDAFKGPKTVNLLQLQNGNSLNLGDGKFQTGSYSKLTLVIDYTKDASGNAPGCYVQKTDGAKEALVISGNAKQEVEITTKKFDVRQSGVTDLMIDFDLRKAIKEMNSNSKKSYAFVTYGELQSSIRLVNRASTGDIVGKIDNYNPIINGQVVVYVYKKGTYNENAEVKGQGESSVTFRNAVTSAKVDGAGNFKIAFLEEGDYELHFATNKSTSGAIIDFSSFLNLNSNLALNSIAVKSNTQVSLSLSIKSIIGL